MSFKEKMRNARIDAGIRVDNAVSMAVIKAKEDFLQKIMKEDEVDYAEAVRLTEEEPEYSLGMKLQVYMVETTLHGARHLKEKKKAFIDSLSPEERAIWEKDVSGMNLGKMVRDEMKRQKVKG